MSKLTDSAIAKSFEEIVGWPYVSPGTNDERGIDCSGAFVRAYRAAGKDIEHGSNAIERKRCHDCFDLNGSADRLRVGMPVFKYREQGHARYALPEKYLPGGNSYNGDLSDYYHIGLVAGINPLRIIHATEPVAKVDTTLGKGDTAWRRSGWLDAVTYTGQTGTDTKEESTVSELAGNTCKVTANTGTTANMRNRKDGELLVRVPLGASVLCMEDDGTWAKIRWENGSKVYIGYMKTEFLELYDYEDGDEPEDAPEQGRPYIKIYAGSMQDALTIQSLFQHCEVGQE